MTLYNLVKTIKAYCTNLPNISYVEEGDVYQLNSKADIDYPAVIISQTQHRGDLDNDTNIFGFNIFAVDRLTSDYGNKLDIQSWANETLEDICSFIEEMNLGIIFGEIIIQPFTERFEAECAGAYATINIQIDNIYCESDKYLINLLNSLKKIKTFKEISELEGVKPNTLLLYTGDEPIQPIKPDKKGHFGIRALEDSEIKTPIYENINLEYSFDDSTIWYNNTPGNTYLLKKGQTIYFKGINDAIGVIEDYRDYFKTLSGSVELVGNIMSLLYSDDYENKFTLNNQYTFCNLFYGNSGIKSIGELKLPATTLAPLCYYYMFSGCTGLTTLPNDLLPSTSLADGCYAAMFSGCTNLTNVPTLPATTLTITGYAAMFSGCTNLTNSPILPATSLADGCYEQMFSGCTGLTDIEIHAETYIQDCFNKWLRNVSPTGTIRKKPSLQLPSGESGIPTGWIVEDI